MYDEKNNNKFIKSILIDLILYIIFLIVSNLLIFSNLNNFVYYSNNVIERLFLTRSSAFEGGAEIPFVDMVTIVDWYAFMETTFIPNLYAQNRIFDKSMHDNGNRNESNEDRSGFGSEKGSGNGTHEELLNNFMLNVAILKQPRIRQVRVKNGTCVVHEKFEKYFHSCYGAYSYDNEDRSPEYLGTPYVKPSEGGGINVWGQVAEYSGGGYKEEFTSDFMYNLDLVRKLKRLHWIDQATRAVFIEFSLYYVNVNLVCIIRLFTVELPPVGGVIPSYTFEAFHLNLIQTNYDYFILCCWFIFILFTVYFSMEEITELFQNYKTYWKSFWNLLNFVIITLSYLLTMIFIWRIIYIRSHFKIENDEKYDLQTSLDNLEYWQFQYKNINGILAFLVWIKIFKYLSFNKTMLQFSTTLNRCSSDLFGFCVMFFIFFMAFALFGYLLFGNVIFDFRTFGDSMFTMLRTIVGDFDYPSIEKANRILGPIFFMAYIFFVFFVLMNMFLAIINDTYSVIKSEITADTMDINGYLKGKLKHFYHFVCPGCCHQIEIKESNEKINENHKINKEQGKKKTDNVRQQDLERRQVTNIEPDRRHIVLSIRESQLRNTLFDEISSESDLESQLRIQRLEERVANLEILLENLIKKIDMTIDNLNKLRSTPK